jgi:hypothetical protein
MSQFSLAFNNEFSIAEEAAAVVSDTQYFVCRRNEITSLKTWMRIRNAYVPAITFCIQPDIEYNQFLGAN